MAFDLFVGTSPGGESVYFLRFFAYSVTYTLFMGYIGLAAGASRRYRLLPVVSVLLFSAASAVAQLSGPPVESVATLVVFGSFIAVIWGFFWPLSREAQSVSAERRLLFGKLRNVATLAFIMYLGVALTNRATLGLLDLFVGVFTIAYVDVIIHLGFVGLLVYSGDALNSLATEYDSPLSIFSES
jgi:bacteriorhodopsin